MHVKNLSRSCFYRFNFDNTMSGYYIAPAFMDKLIVHISKNFMTLPNIKVSFPGFNYNLGKSKSMQFKIL